MTTHTQALVIGGGPGGYPAAFLLADFGFEVTVVDVKPNPGGVCLFQGCIPSKALLHIARLLNETRESAAWGLAFEPPKVDLVRLRAWKDQVVGKLTGGLGLISKRRKVRLVQGRARFEDAKTVAVDPVNGGSGERFTFDHAIVATGSLPSELPFLPKDSKRVMDSTAALELADIPPRLLIIGGGYIGLEMGTVYSALGSKTTVVEATGGLLPGADRDLVRELQKRLRNTFAGIHLNTKVTEVREEGEALRVKLLGLDLPENEPQFDRIIVAVGRRPNSRDLGLEKAGIELDPKGFVKVDAQRRTSAPGIWAIGDVAGEPMLAHKATYEGRVAANAIAGRASAYDPKAIPAVVFTDPEIAWCGLTESQALTEGREVTVARFPWAASGRATTLSRSDGLTKLLIDPHDERLLGVGIAGVGAGEMIAEAVLAIEMGARASDLMMTIHAHPTLSETMMEAAEVYFGHSPHVVGR